MIHFGALNWSIIIVYLLGNLLLGWQMSRRVKSAENYYLGDRSAPWWAIGISVLATYVSALSFLGGPAWAYGDGMAALIIHVNYALVIFVCVVYFIPFFYNSGVASIYDYLERRFGITTRVLIGFLFMITMLIGSASILTATSLVITFITGIDTTTSIIILTAIVIVYTMLGGMNAVIWTDVLQGAILIIGAIIVLFSLFSQIESLNTAFSYLDENQKLNPINLNFDLAITPTIWAGVFAMTLYHITVYGANQFMVQRTLAAKNIGDAKKSYLLMGFAAFFLYFIFFFIGALLYFFYQGKAFDDANQIILIFIESLKIPGLLGIIAAAIMAASMSSTSSALNSLSTITITDFYQKFFNTNASESHYLTMSRVFTVLWGILLIPVAIAFANTNGEETSILEILSKVASYFVGAKLCMFGIGFFSKHITERGLIIGIFFGFIGLMLLVPLSFLEPSIDSLWQALNLNRPDIAWPWYPVVAGGINLLVSWVASICLDGFQKTWHPYTVQGQLNEFKKHNKPIKAQGWYLVPGKVEPVVWLLPVCFIGIMFFLVWFASLG